MINSLLSGNAPSPPPKAFSEGEKIQKFAVFFFFLQFCSFAGGGGQVGESLQLGEWLKSYKWSNSGNYIIKKRDRHIHLFESPAHMLNTLNIRFSQFIAYHGGGGYLYFVLGIILVKVFSKSTLSMYFLSSESRPKICVFFLFLFLPCRRHRQGIVSYSFLLSFFLSFFWQHFWDL